MENNNQKQVTFEDIENNEEINEYITKGNEYLGVMNYTEHGFAHLKRSAVYARRILEDLGYDERMCRRCLNHSRTIRPRVVLAAI